METKIVTAKVERGELLAAVQYASKAVSRRGGALPVLLGLRLEIGRGWLSVTGTDLDMVLTQAVDVDADGQAVVIVPAKLLAKLLKAKHSPVTLTVDPKGDELRVELGGMAYVVRTLPVSEWPTEPQFPAGTAVPVSLDARQVDLLKRLSVAASKDFARPVLTAMSIEEEAVVATDSYRLGWVDTALRLPKCLLPAEVVNHLEPECEVEVRDHWVRWWNTSGRDGCARLIDGEFPNWRSLVPSADAATVPRVRFGPDFVPALGQLVKAARDVTTPVRLEANGDGVKATVRCADAITGERVLPARFRRRAVLPVAVAFNPGYLTDLAKAVKGDVRMDLTDPLRPALISGDDPDLTFLLMPVRV